MTGKKEEMLCPYCPQTCSTPWNLKVHIQRKHPRKGEQVRSASHSTSTQFVSNLSNIPANDSFHQTYPANNYYSEHRSEERINETPPSKKRDNTNDEILETLRQIVEIKNMTKQLRLTSGQPSIIGSIPLTLPPSPNLMNFYLIEYIVSNTKGFRGRICYNCFSYWVDPVFNIEEMKSLMPVKLPTHTCEPKKVDDAQHLLYIPSSSMQKN